MFLHLTTLRDRRSDASAFRRAAGRVIMYAFSTPKLVRFPENLTTVCRAYVRRILIENVLGKLDSRVVEIVTTSGHVATGIERKSPLCGVKLGDEGYPFSVIFHQVEVDAAEGIIQSNAGIQCIKVRIATAAIDRSVDPRTEDIIPGIGNFIARYNDDGMYMNV
ncbi:unnamed protein product [Phytophthora fragariaefolia]|uniref:Unnamed protein product n=1 Tax=Phytophthora fragariaefolia TaxID=1490495 RepID=A0A9W7D2J9_9STRA|nr:unnamed protein product [Phytophthora fragariaefolia]